MLSNFGYIGLFVIVAIGFPLFAIFIPMLLRLINLVPSNPNPTKTSPFECGMPTTGKTWVQFNFRYYFYALVFLVVDVMILFLFPLAVNLRQLGYFGFVVASILIAIILIGYIYAWKKKALEWK